MKRIYYVTALALLLISLCACGASANTDNTEQAGNFSDEMVIEGSGNFSSEMFIEASTDVTIVEMQ